MGFQTFLLNQLPNFLNLEVLEMELMVDLNNPTIEIQPLHKLHNIESVSLQYIYLNISPGMMILTKKQKK